MEKQENLALRVDVYSKERCVQCVATERMLGRLGLELGEHFAIHRLEEDDDALTYLKKQGVAAAPAVTISSYDLYALNSSPNEAALDHPLNITNAESLEIFNGYRPDMLKKMGELVIIQASTLEKVALTPQEFLKVTSPPHKTVRENHQSLSEQQLR